MAVLKGIDSRFVHTPRIRSHVLTHGSTDGVPVVLVHGNASSSTFYEELMLRLPDEYRCIAPDMRGYGLTEVKPIDATRGARDWSDDLESLREAMGLSSFHLVGWSLGGGVAMQYVIDHPSQVRTLTLIAPVSPYGFSGTRGPEGTPCFPDHAGSGAGGVTPEFPKLLLEQSRESGANPMLPRNVLNSAYVRPPYRSAREEDLLTSILSTAVGPDNYPGDATPSPNWPGYAPGTRGALNAFSSKYFCAKDIVEITPKPPILWIRGADDQIVSDTSLWDIAFLGKLGFVPGWPGDDVYPPQPMIAQTRALLQQYAARGGSYREVVFEECGHSPHIEKEDEFVTEFLMHAGVDA